MRKCITNHFNIFAFIILALVVFGLYGKSITYDWQYLDDDVLILEKQDYLKLSNIKTMFTDTFFGVPGDTGYRPLLNVSFAIDSTFSGLNPTAYHISNILIFLFAVFSIYLLFSYKNNKVWSLFFSLIIAVNPLLCAVVCRPVDRSDSLLTLFSVLSFYFLIKFLESQQKCTMYNVQCTINDKQQSVIPECSNREFAVSSSDHPTIRLSDHQSSRRCRSCSYSASQLLSFSAHILFFSMALFTKETALVLPIIFILFLFLRRSSVPQSVIPECSNRESMLNKTPLSPSLLADEVGVAIHRRCRSCRSSASQLLSFSAVVLLYIIISAGYLFYRSFVLSYQTQSLNFHIFFDSFITSFPAVTKYIANIFFPVKLTVFSTVANADYILCIMVFLIFVWLLLKFKEYEYNVKIILFGFVWFFTFLLPTFIIPYNQFYDHRIYLSLAGILLSISEIIKNYDEKFSKKTVTIFTIIFILFSLITFTHSHKFMNRNVFWINALIDCPESDIANSVVAGILVENRAYDLAEEKYLKAISIHKNSKHYVNLAVLYIKTGRFDKAEECLLKAQALDEYNPEVYYNLALIYKVKGDMEKAQYMKTLFERVFRATNKVADIPELRI